MITTVLAASAASSRLRKQPPQHGLRAQQRKSAVGDVQRRHVLGLPRTGHLSESVAVRADILESRALFAVNEVEKWRDRQPRNIDARRLVPDPDQLLRMRVAQRLQQHPLHHAEHHRIRPDADCQGDERDRREEWGPSQPPEYLPELFAEVRHSDPSSLPGADDCVAHGYAFATSLLCSREIREHHTPRSDFPRCDKAARLPLHSENRFTRSETMWFLGMDVGTGGTRAVVVDEAGKLISGASSEHAPFRTPHPGWAEQDPEDWWRAAQDAIRTALSVGARTAPAHRRHRPHRPDARRRHARRKRRGPAPLAHLVRHPHPARMRLAPRETSAMSA